MKFDKTFILEKAAIVIGFIKRFRFVLAFGAFSLMYGYILVQVNNINQRQPSDVQIGEKVTAVPRTKVDPELAKKILSLEDQNIQIRTIFNQARKNPFDE